MLVPCVPTGNFEHTLRIFPPFKKGTPTYQPTYHTTYTYLHLPLAVVQLHLRLPTPIPRGAAANLAGRTETNNDTEPRRPRENNEIMKSEIPPPGVFGASPTGVLVHACFWGFALIA